MAAVYSVNTSMIVGKAYPNSGLTSKAYQEQESNCEWDTYSLRKPGQYRTTVVESSYATKGFVIRKSEIFE